VFVDAVAHGSAAALHVADVELYVEGATLAIIY
jgi:hypothetical protein